MSKEVDSINRALPALQNREKMLQVFQDNYNEGIRMGDLERVRIPSGGGTHWKLDTLNGEEFVTEIKGVLVAWHSSRAYFITDEDERPACTSLDGKKGIGDPGGFCESCALSVWRENERGGGGSACKEQRTLYLLTDKGILPLLLILPVTSIGAFRKLMVRLSSHMLSHWEVLLSLTLKEEKSKGGIKYSQAEIKPERKLSKEEAEAVQAYRTDLMQKLSALQKIAEEEEIPDAEPVDPDEIAAAEAAFRKIEEEGFPLDEEPEPDQAPPAAQPAPAAKSQSPDGIPDDPKAQPGDDPFSKKKSNDEALSKVPWEGFIPKEEKDKKIFQNTYAARFYMRMAKKGYDHDAAQAWIFKLTGFDPKTDTDLSSKDILADPVLIQMVNEAFFVEFGELLFIRPDLI